MQTLCTLIQLSMERLHETAIRAPLWTPRMPPFPEQTGTLLFHSRKHHILVAGGRGAA